MRRSFLFLLLSGFAAAAAEPPKEIRVMSWNLHHGVGEDGKLDLERHRRPDPRTEAVASDHRPLVAVVTLP